MRGMRREHLLFGITVAAVVVAVGLPTAAIAAPWQSPLAGALPDADMYCEGELVDGFVGHPSAASIWIDAGDEEHHYVIESTVHYFAPGLWTEPVEDPEGLTVVGATTYGARTGIDHAMTCQVVSRWADQEFTIFADLELAGPVGR